MIKSLLPKHLVAAVIPAFNESGSIEKVVRGVSLYATVLVVDDGSSDGTAVLARSAGALVVIHDSNQGYDRALESGLFRALALGFDYAITMDGDGQHLPETLELFKEQFLSGADLVVGVRDRNQRFAESIFSIVSRSLWGIRDPLCGMKGYRLLLLAQAGHFDSYGSIGTELALRAAKSGYMIKEVPVPTRARTGISRFGVGMRANLKILRALILGLFASKIDRILPPINGH
jgi:glycosyltransferase involved in cell wall biosynthesis